MEGIKISSLAEYIEVMKKIQTKYDIFVYRGQSDFTWKAVSGVYRRIEESKKLAKLKQTNVSSNDVLDYLKGKLHEARKRISAHQMLEIKEMNDISLLVEMQHYGGATNLIDFSLNPLISLYFASIGSPNTDGRVFCITYSNPYKVLSGRSELLADLFPSPVGKLYAYSPSHSNPRIIKQDSIFIFNDIGYIDDSLIDHNFLINAESKVQIIQDLRDIAGITEESIYPDFIGYLQANNFRIPFKIKNAQDYFEQAVPFHRNGNFMEAIEYYKKSLELDSEQWKPHLGIAQCLRQLENFSESAKYSRRATELEPTLFMNWNEFAIINTYLHDYTEAKSSFSKAEQLIENESQQQIYAGNFGWMYMCFGEWDLAKGLLEPLVNEEKPYHHAINLGHCYLIEKNPDMAIKMYLIAYQNSRTPAMFWNSMDSDYRHIPLSRFDISNEIFKEIKDAIKEKTGK